MANRKWVTVEAKWCDQIGMAVEMQQLRNYPAAILPDTIPFQVSERRCTAGIACNLTGIRCQWAYTNPGVDLFDLLA